jgi:hypothetical protein
VEVLNQTGIAQAAGLRSCKGLHLLVSKTASHVLECLGWAGIPLMSRMQELLLGVLYFEISLTGLLAQSGLLFDARRHADERIATQR